jgi:hypothetical protein
MLSLTLMATAASPQPTRISSGSELAEPARFDPVRISSVLLRLMVLVGEYQW